MKQLYDSLPDIIWKGEYVVDTESFINTYISDVAEELLKLEKGTLNNSFDNFFKLILPEYLDKVLENLRDGVRNPGKTFSYSYKMYRGDGTIGWYETSGRSYINKGKIEAFGVTKDISERIQAQNDIEVSQTRFSELIRHFPSGIAIYTPVDEGADFKFIGFNLKAEQLTNSKQEDIIGHTLLEKFPNVLHTPFLEALRKAYLSGDKVHIPSFYYKDNNHEGWRENHIYSLPNGEIVSVFQDVSVFKKQEELLIEKNSELENAIQKAENNEYRFKALHNASFGGITIHDKGVILDCNDGLSKITGYSHKELVGMNGLLLIAKEYRDMVLTNIADQYEKPYEVKGLKKDGSIYPLRMEGRMIPYKGMMVRVTEFRDITERNRIVQELINAKEKAIQSDRLKSAFLTNMSHEIRTPMNGILGFIDLLNTPGLTENERKEFTSTIQKSSNRLLETINDIITYSQIEAGDVTIAHDEIDVRELLKSHVRFFAPEMNEKGLEMIIENYLPEDSCRIMTDKVKLDSILTNLIKNAIKFTNSGQVIVGVQEKNGKLEFFVKDTGIGIPEEKHKLIFDRFVQADMGISRGHEGSGLGLAICRGYVKNLGGEIWVESVPDKGSTFRFTTKFRKAEVHKIIEDNQQDRANKTALNKNPEVPVMLIAEDDETSFELLVMILGKNRYRYLHAENGVEAVELYMNNPDIDLILMDLKMPEMDGLEATRRIREMDKQIPIIAQTAFAFDSDIEEAYAAGCSDYVTKPIRRHEILQKISECL